MTDNERLLDALAADQDGFWTSIWMIDACDGDMAAARMLARLMFWFKRGKDGEPRARIMRKGKRWVAKRHDDWWDEIRLSEFQAKRAAAKLTTLGLAESEHFMFSGMRTVHYRLDADEIARAVSANPRRPKVSADSRLPESAESGRPLTGGTAQEVAQENTPAAPDAAGAALDAGGRDDAPATGVTPGQPESMANAVNGTHPAANGRSGKPPRAARGGAAPLGPGAVVYRDVVHLTPNHVQRVTLDDALAAHGEARMRAVLADWLGRGYSPKNVTGMVDAMAHGLNGYARNGNGRAAPDFSQVIL